jgi:uncharacterized coiled-coil protein SlyX
MTDDLVTILFIAVIGLAICVHLLWFLISKQQESLEAMYQLFNKELYSANSTLYTLSESVVQIEVDFYNLKENVYLLKKRVDDFIED